MSKENASRSSTAQIAIAVAALLSLFFTMLDFMGYDKEDAHTVINTIREYDKISTKDRVSYLKEANYLLGEYKVNFTYTDSLDRIGKTDTVITEKDSFGTMKKFNIYEWEYQKSELLEWLFKVRFNDGSIKYVQFDTSAFAKKISYELTPAERMNDLYPERNDYNIIFDVFRIGDTNSGIFSEWHNTYFEITLRSTGTPKLGYTSSKYPKVNANGVGFGWTPPDSLRKDINEEKSREFSHIEPILVDSSIRIIEFIKPSAIDTFKYQPRIERIKKKPSYSLF